VLCPHLLGWKNGRALLLSYQASGSTSAGPLSANRKQRWRWMSVDELDGPAITDDVWQTATNYHPHNVSLDVIEIAVQI
jgi:hypothetical protein